MFRKPNHAAIAAKVDAIMADNKRKYAGFTMILDPLQILENLDKATSADLNAALADLKDALDAATKADPPDLEVARDLKEAIGKVTAEQATREENAKAAREEAAELRKGIFDEEKPAEGDDADTDEGEEEKPAEEKPAEAQKPEPVAASVLDRLRAHAAARTTSHEKGPKIKLGAHLKSVGPASGTKIDDNADFGALGQLFATHSRSVMSSGPVPLARLEREFEEGRKLGHNLEQNNRRISDVLGYGGARPQTAAGGLCGPGDVDHTHPICADTGRPVRDSLPQFNAARGRVTFAPAAGLGDLDGAVSIWTADTDSAPGTATKPCPPVLCPEEDFAEVDAIVRCLTVGNFQAKFSPEFWASRLQLLLATFDRAAEQKAISEIDAASTALPTYADGDNTLANFLQAVNNIISSDRSAQRNLSGSYTVLADSWLRDQIRNQVIQNLGVANNVETLQIADSMINGWLADVNATAVWTPDGTIDDGTGLHRVLTPGTVPTDATIYVHPEDAFFFLDGGTLDLGTEIRDSGLNATNDRQAFAESFEKVAFRGCSAYKQEITLANLCGCIPG
jgi:hypothetical protein